MLVMTLGAWSTVVSLVGPYFNYGFFTDQAWTFSTIHWELLILPGAVVFIGGLLMTMPKSGLTSLGSLLALVGGAWLVASPSLYPLWTSSTGIRIAVPHSELMRALLWIGYFYGTGALITYFAGFGQGLLAKRTVIEDSPVIEETPVDRTERVVTHA
jgi:hypothetical protein